MKSSRSSWRRGSVRTTSTRRNRGRATGCSPAELTELQCIEEIAERNRKLLQPLLDED
jgi:hypothetical protein